MIGLNNRERKQKILSGKEVRRMKRFIALAISAAMIFAGPVSSVMADTHGTVTAYDQYIDVHVEYNAFGQAVYSENTTTTTVTTTDAEGNVSTSTTTNTVISTFHNGSLKPDTSTTDSVTVDSKGQVLSESHYTDTYTYVEGYLDSVSGGGSYDSWTYDKDGNVTEHRSGTITRTFEVRDGQALLISSTTSGAIFDKDDNSIGTFSNTSTFTYGEYKGGSWLLTQEVSTSTSNWDNGNSETITRTTTYTRDAEGVITGITQTATGERTVVNGDDPGGLGLAAGHYTLTNYSAEVAFDPQMGWYIASEDYRWQIDVTDPEDRTAYDPWTVGTLAMVDGHLALIVDPDDVEGREFYNMDPTSVTGETQRDEDGNYIFMLGVDDAGTLAELQGLIGSRINLMWQYYTQSSAEDSCGYGWIWLAPVSDWRVSVHLQHDNEAMVEQWGGDWDRTKQYVIIG